MKSPDAARTSGLLGRALVVDDDPAWRQILGELLADGGLAVDLAGSLKEARAQLGEAPHRLAIVDLSLGGTGRDQEGLQALEAVRRQDPGCVAILLTGFATVELAVSALTDHGAYTCLRKDTFRRAEFRDLLARVLALPPTSGPHPASTEAPAAGRDTTRTEVAPFEAAPREPSALPASRAQRPGARASQQQESTPAPGPSVLLVEDEAGWRSILVQILADAGYRVRACPSFGEALGYLRRENYALAVVDLSLASSLAPGSNRDGWQMLAKTRAAGIPAIVVSGSAAPADVERAYAEHGIFAYLEKQAFSRSAFLSLAGEAAATGRPASAELEGLTERERDVLALLAQGLTNKEIAGQLIISTNTVKRYLKSVFEKLSVDTRSAAAARAISAGLGAPRRGD